MELKLYTPFGQKLVFEKIRSEVLHYIQHDFICQCPGLSKDQISKFKTPVINYLSSNIVTHSNGYIKGGKYFFFIKVCAAMFS